MYFERINSTICTLATAKGSTIGIVRISGKGALKIASKLTKKHQFEDRKICFAKLYDGENVIEQCIVLPFFSPHSFTGEDVVELQLHGAEGNAEQILGLVIKNGAVPALRGEFSFRAVLNSKMTLNQALAVNTLVTTQNPVAIELSRKAAFENKTVKTLETLIPSWDRSYTMLTAIVDFPDQIAGNLDFNEVSELIKSTKSALNRLKTNSESLKRLVSYTILLLGRPNVGKSSLFNTLVDRDRAIVSEIPGTTRDYISETYNVRGFQVRLIDSAGIRETENELECRGVDKSRKLVDTSDLVVLVFDSSQPLSDEDRALIRETSIKSRVFVKNKSDLEDKIGDSLSGFSDSVISLCCRTGEGLAELKSRIEEELAENLPDVNEAVFFSEWQSDISEKLISQLEELSLYLDSDQVEIFQFCVREILNGLKNLVGDFTDQDVFEKIFGGFCLGK
ncbi:tRNA uridine-5-carboxymethylaminomethyl(34) synthesis GTPase MnmE [bacterium]|nr:tRNA uridine-5-carboxymethylaminomethyl(34) synthesis GTPase MnmE [bacterium]